MQFQGTFAHRKVRPRNPEPPGRTVGHRMKLPIDRSANPNTDAVTVLLGSVSEAARALAAAQSASTKLPKLSVGSSIIVDSSRDRWLEPDYALALSSSCRRRKDRLARVFGVIGLTLAAVALPADFTFQFPFSDFWRHFPIDRGIEVASPSLGPDFGIRHETAVPRLIVNSSRAVSGEPAPLGVALQGQADRAVVVITGLAPGMELSAGSSVGVDTWEVLATDLGDTWIGPPKNFIGSVELVAELRLSDNKISDRQAVYVHWVPVTSATPVVPQLDERFIAEAQTISAAPEQKQGDSPETSAEPQFYLQSAQSQSEIKIIAAARSLPTLSQNQFDQEAVKAAPADSVSMQEQPELDEVQTLRSISRTQAPNHFDQKEIAAAPPNLPSAAPGQLAQDETATVPMISTAPAQSLSAQDIVAVSAGLPTPAQKKLDQETIAAQPILASALPKKLVMAESRPSPTPLQYQPNRDDVRTAPTVPKSQGQLDPEQLTAGPPTSSPPQRALDNEEIAALLRRAKNLIASGDIAAARLLLLRAADANDPKAALALGATYDPLVLRELRVYGLTADAAMARVWYEKARAFGSVAATRRLEMLTTGAR
jgi:hypothetical protein